MFLSEFLSNVKKPFILTIVFKNKAQKNKPDTISDLLIYLVRIII